MDTEKGVNRRLGAVKIESKTTKLQALSQLMYTEKNNKTFLIITKLTTSQFPEHE